MNKILTLLSLLSRLELNSETEAKKLEQITSKQITELTIFYHQRTTLRFD